MAVSMLYNGVRLFERAKIGHDWKELPSIGNNRIILYYSSKLSETGNIIAINDGSATKTFKYDEAAIEWKQYGSAMTICNGTVEKNVSLSLSSDGTKLAFSANCGNDAFNTQVFNSTSPDGGWNNLTPLLDGGRKMQLSGDGMILALLNETNCLNMYGLKIEERVIANCDYMDATSIALSGSGHRVAIARTNYVKPLVILRCNIQQQ